MFENYRVYDGRTFKIEFYYSEQGKMAAYEYYQNLTEKEKRRFFIMISHFADSLIGVIFPKTLFNIEDKSHGIYAFKPFIHRFFCFFTGDRKIILLNAYQKHSQKMAKLDKGVLVKAINLKNDYVYRVQKGTYYE